MQKGFSNVLLIIIGILIGIAAIGYFSSSMKNAPSHPYTPTPTSSPSPVTGPTPTPTPSPTPTPPQELACGITVTSPAANDTVTATVNVAGSVNGSCHWAGFEGQVGTVQVFDSRGNPLSATSILNATGDWMQLPVSFTSRLTINTPPQHTATGYLLFKNEDPSGNFPQTYQLPIRF